MAGNVKHVYTMKQPLSSLVLPLAHSEIHSLSLSLSHTRNNFDSRPVPSVSSCRYITTMHFVVHVASDAYHYPRQTIQSKGVHTFLQSEVGRRPPQGADTLISGQGGYVQIVTLDLTCDVYASIVCGSAPFHVWGSSSLLSFP